MPKNKEALVRYRVINRCLKDQKYITMEKLIRACEDALDISPIGKRTLEGDIHSMRYDAGLAYHAPICFDRGRRAYYYDDPDYSIDRVPLNEEELQSLAFAATLLDQFKEVEIFARFTGSVQKIIDAVNIRRMHEDESKLDFVDFEKAPFVKGSEFLNVIINAIRQKEVITIRYRAFSSDHDHIHDIHPYLLKEYRNRWYLTGLHDHFREIRIYGLDRIVEIKTNPAVTYTESGFSPREYFRNTIGIFSPLSEPPTIVLEFSRDVAQYIVTQPIHESQQLLRETKDSLVFCLKVHPTVELIQLILGWGEYVKVLEPPELVSEIKWILEEARGRYDRGN
jgi:predicted DNA-binding transcriptional regulator YafY